MNGAGDMECDRFQGGGRPPGRPGFTAEPPAGTEACHHGTGNVGRFAAALLAVLVMAGCASHARRENTPAVARFFLEAPAEANTTATLPVSGVRIAIAPKPVITEFDIVNVEIAQVKLGKCLMFQLTPAAARDLYRMTVANPGRRLVLVLNGRALGARRIDRPLEHGTIFTFVEVPDGKLPELTAGLKRTSADLRREGGQKT